MRISYPIYPNFISDSILACDFNTSVDQGYKVLVVLGEFAIVRSLNFNYVCVWLLLTGYRILGTQLSNIFGHSVAVVPVNFLRTGLPNNFMVQLFCITLVKDYVATTLPADHVTTAEK